MNRIIPTAVIGFVVLMLMQRGFETASATANNQTNSSVLPTVDGVMQTASQGGAQTFPFAMLAAGVAAVLGLGLLFGGGR